MQRQTNEEGLKQQNDILITSFSPFIQIAFDENKQAREVNLNEKGFKRCLRFATCHVSAHKQ